MTTEEQMIADQSAYIEPTEDQVKIVTAKALLKQSLSYVQPHPFETDLGAATCRLRDAIEWYLEHESMYVEPLDAD